MKRKIIFMLFAITMLFVFASCNIMAPIDDVIDLSKLNTMSKVDYSSFTLDVISKIDDSTQLKSSFIVKTGSSTQVDYNVEKLSEISFDSPDDFISTISGSVIIEDDKIKSIEGDVFDIEFSEITKVGFTFKKEYFKDIRLTDNFFSARVVSPKEFLGTDEFDCKNMTVSASFSSYFKRINISFTSAEGVAVECEYTFTK